jgi:origin recognition complex subunit 5
MAHPLPHQLSQTLSQHWPCRETQIRQLAALLDVSITTELHGNGCYLIAF